jgi:hypothetical protein
MGPERAALRRIFAASCGFCGVPVDYLYSLYDALVSINVPSDKARAVVDAMERDMGTTLATKQDLVSLRQELRQDLQLLEQKFDNRFSLLDQKSEAMGARLDQKIDRLRDDMTRDLAALDLRMTVKLGSMLFVGFGLTITAMRLWT